VGINGCLVTARPRPPVVLFDHALIARIETLDRVPGPFLLRSDNLLVFTNHSYTALVRSYGLRQELITLNARSKTA